MLHWLYLTESVNRNHRATEGSLDAGKVLANEHISLERMKLAPSSILVLTRGSLPAIGLTLLSVFLRSAPPELNDCPANRISAFRAQTRSASEALNAAIGAAPSDEALPALPTISSSGGGPGVERKFDPNSEEEPTAYALMPLWEDVEFSLELPLSDLLEALRSHPSLAHLSATAALRLRVLRRSDQPGSVVACLDKPLRAQGVNPSTAPAPAVRAAAAYSRCNSWAQLVLEVLPEGAVDARADGGLCSVHASIVRLYGCENLFPSLTLPALNALRARYDGVALREWQQVQAVKREVEMARAEVLGNGATPVFNITSSDPSVQLAAALTADISSDDVFTSTFSQVHRSLSSCIRHGALDRRCCTRCVCDASICRCLSDRSPRQSSFSTTARLRPWLRLNGGCDNCLQCFCDCFI